MMGPALDSYKSLRSYARMRLRQTGEPLLPVVQGLSSRELVSDLLAPEAMSLGYFTDRFASLNDEQKMTLNHWLYYLHYFRIAVGEEYVIMSNAAIAEALDSEHPDVAGLLRLENEEEHDHLATFRAIRHEVGKHYGWDQLAFPLKPARKWIGPGFVRFLVKRFQSDYVVAYFLGRGMVNHMGKAFEQEVAKVSPKKVHLMSRLHTEDENKHMAVSHLFSASARLFFPPRKTGPAYRTCNTWLRYLMVKMTFSESVTKRQEAAMSRLALRKAKAFSSWRDEEIESLIADHFASYSGVERAKNAKIAGPNQRILDSAALDENEKEIWKAWMLRDPGNLEFFPP